MTLSRPQLLRLARAGAQARVAELQAEIDAIRRAFPDLGRGKTAAAARPSKIGRRGWTPAQRKAAADRMKKYWAAKKTGKK